jgi:hypothetical protein
VGVPMTEREYRAIINRQRRLPEMLDAARRKVRALENEARRYGMKELLQNPEHVNKAWDREVENAWLENEEWRRG